MVTVTLHGRSCANFVAHQHVDLQVFTFVVPQFEPLYVISYKLVVPLVFLDAPIVVRIFLMYALALTRQLS